MERFVLHSRRARRTSVRGCQLINKLGVRTLNKIVQALYLGQVKPKGILFRHYRSRREYFLSDAGYSLRFLPSL